MNPNSNIMPPPSLPMLASLCWQCADVRDFSEQEILALYERGWHYVGVLADISPTEKHYIQQLKQRYGSWLPV